MPFENLSNVLGLGNPYAQHPFLRELLGYKRPWVYYLAMIIDPLLRFNWVFYLGFTGELQHLALMSFFISLSEIGRRAMWTLFRVENEHCSNVGRFRASRDVPLPYELPSPDVEEPTSPLPVPGPERASSDLSSLRRRRTVSLGDTPISRGLVRMGTMVAEAHAQDFERKRRASVVGQDDGKERDEGGSSDEDEEDAMQEDVNEAQQILHRHPSATHES